MQHAWRRKRGPARLSMWAASTSWSLQLCWSPTSRSRPHGVAFTPASPRSAALEDEGFDDLGSGKLVESFARHFMVAVDAWQEHGFNAVAKNYLARLSPESGVRREIADNGDLLVRRTATNADRAERLSLLTALAEPSWLDPATGGPRR